MAVERRRQGELDAGQIALHAGGHAGQIALQMDAEGEEIREDVNLAGALGGEQTDGAGQVGLAVLEKSRLHARVAALPGELRRDQAHGLIGRFHARPVGENDDARL